MLFKHFNHRYSQRNHSPHTLSPHTKLQLTPTHTLTNTQTTRVVFANGRMYRSLEVSTESKKKSKKNHNISLFDKVIKNKEVTTPSSSKRLSRPVSQREKSRRQREFSSKRQDKNRQTIESKHSNNKTTSIHDLVFSRCLDYVNHKQPSSNSKQEISEKFGGDQVSNKKQKMMMQLKKQFTDIYHSPIKNSNPTKKNQMVLKEYCAIKPITQIQRLGRLTIRNKADREMFRIQLNSQINTKEKIDSRYSKKALQKDKMPIKEDVEVVQSRTDKDLFNLPLKVYLKQQDFKVQSPAKQKSFLLRKQNNNLFSKVQQQKQEKVYVKSSIHNTQKKQQKHVPKQTTLVSDLDISIQQTSKSPTSKMLSSKNIPKEKFDDSSSTKKNKKKSPQKLIKRTSKFKTSNSIQSMESIRLDTKEQEVVFQMTQRSQDKQGEQTHTQTNQQEEEIDQISLSSIKKSKTISSSIKKQESVKEFKETVQSLKQKNQAIRPVGQIIGHGLKLLKGVNINWILPCVPMYRIFYQIRVDIQNQAEKYQVQNQFIAKNRHQNQRIQLSYKNMIKAAQKKPLSPEQRSELETSKITDSVTFETIIAELLKYSKMVEIIRMKQELKDLVKVHLTMMINSVFYLAHFLGRIQTLHKISEQQTGIDNEILRGITLIKNIK